MRLTVIPSDKTIYLDGKVLEVLEWPFDDHSINAIQWYNNYGIIEYLDPDKHDGIATSDFVQPYIKCFTDEWERRAQAEQAQLNAKTITYAEIRPYFYPTIGDQLDAAYWAFKGDPTLQEAVYAKIEEVKAAYPKDMEPISYLELEALLNSTGN